MRTVKFYSLGKFQLFSTVLLNIVTMLCIRSLDHIHPVTPGKHFFTFCFCEFNVLFFFPFWFLIKRKKKMLLWTGPGLGQGNLSTKDAKFISISDLAMNTFIYVSWCKSSPQSIPRNGLIAGLWATSIFNFIAYGKFWDDCSYWCLYHQFSLLTSVLYLQL